MGDGGGGGGGVERKKSRMEVWYRFNSKVDFVERLLLVMLVCFVY